MALRRLDNELPLTTERPKKQIKIIIPPQEKAKLAEPGVNDENQIHSQPPAVDVSIDYIPSEDLTEIPDPDVNIQGLIGGLESKDWLKACESLNDVRRFALYHSSLLLPILEKIVLVMVKAMKNPRSALIKTSIMACADMFKAFGEKLFESSTSDAFSQLLLQLLLKASQDKKFVCEEAERALKVMVESMTPLPLLHKLSVYVGHMNLKVRAKAAFATSICISKMNLDGMQEFGLVPLLQIAVKLLSDKLPEAREAARGMVMSLYKAITEKEEEKQETWERFCQTNLSAIDAQAMVKLVSS